MPKNAFGARLSSCEVKSIVFFFSIKSPLLGRCVNKRVQQISIQISSFSVIFSLASDNFLTYSEKKLSLNEKKREKTLKVKI